MRKSISPRAEKLLLLVYECVRGETLNDVEPHTFVPRADPVFVTCLQERIRPAYSDAMCFKALERRGYLVHNPKLGHYAYWLTVDGLAEVKRILPHRRLA